MKQVVDEDEDETSHSAHVVGPWSNKRSKLDLDIKSIKTRLKLDLELGATGRNSIKI